MVQLSLSTSWRHVWDSEVWAPLILNLSARWWVVSTRSGRFTPEKKTSTHWIGPQGRSGRSGEEKILTPPGQLKDKELGPLVEWYKQGTAEVMGEKFVPVPLCPPQIPHGLTWNYTQASALAGRRTPPPVLHGVSYVTRRNIYDRNTVAAIKT